MKKFFVHMICLFVPSRPARHKIREKLLFDPIDAMHREVRHALAQHQGWISDRMEKRLKTTEDRISDIRANQQLTEKQIAAIGTNVKKNTAMAATMSTEIEKSRQSTEKQIAGIGLKLDLLKSKILESKSAASAPVDYGKILLEMNRMMQIYAFAAAKHPAVFGKYKNAFAGRDVVLMATGPSLGQFRPINGAIYIGVNAAVKYDKVKLDYLVVQDWRAVKDFPDELNACPATKFYGILPKRFYQGDPNGVIPNHIIEKHNANQFVVNVVGLTGPEGALNFPFDISANPPVCSTSVIITAMQIALWGNPRRVYLVGCDCSSGYFNNPDAFVNGGEIIPEWEKIKNFARHYYPEVEIISVNPVGLKGMFTDLHQKDEK